MFHMPGRSHSGPLPPLSEAEAEIQLRLEGHVRALAGQIGERNLGRAGSLDAAARYLDGILRGLGFAVEAQEFEVEGTKVANLESALGGGALHDQIVLAGAHYDSVVDCPGANDNGSGAAAVLELARLLAPERLARTLRFALFVNEEPPYYLGDAMGSRRYARRCRARGERIVAMLCLETIGYYTDAPRSQAYPAPLGVVYPSTGNFIGFVGNVASRALVRRCIGSFRRSTAFPSEGLAAPDWIAGVGWSDHSSFWEQGYPAVMVTDTALFRYPPYHTSEDKPEKIRYDHMARVVAGLARVLVDLAETPDLAFRS
ncbi:MAG: aminopeptidase [Acidobacteria bacterium]|nr:MAG: aminopeptidase [Acidobacteriota bacterium]